MVATLKTDKNFDPLTIKEVHSVHFNRSVGLLNPHHLEGDLKFHSTVITGLSHVQRIGNSVTENKNGSFLAQLKFGDSNVKARGFVSIHAGHHIHPELQVEADIGDIAVRFVIELGADGKPALKQFEIEEFEHVKIHVHGLLLLDPLVDVVGDAYIALFNSQV